ncbi:MAG: DUF5690 family protein [Verrucomicrobiota bacterium]|nr:DUF5690 family protein [Verrucomicrobiota bacterium]
MSVPTHPITRWLSKAPAPVFSAYAILTSFVVYFSMYAFRKPFAAATFENQYFFGSNLELKTALVISQIIGYTISKYLGIKVCSEVHSENRAKTLVALILFAQGSLFLTALLPGSWKFVALFINGIPLGMVWGLVVWYLEGRRNTELLLAGLSCSFIVSSGMVKDIGRNLLASGMSESWMPATVGLLFLPIFLFFVWLLDRLPPPTPEDVQARHERVPMDHNDRLSFLNSFLWGLLSLFVVYFFLTAYRDFRDNYAVEILGELGYSQAPAILTRTELPVAFGVLVPLALLIFIRNNRLGLIAAYSIMLFGLAMMGAASMLLDRDIISGVTWMILIGLGSYLAYVPFGSVLFDRLIASTRASGTAVFAIYVADAIGYTGSVGIQIYRDFSHADVTRFLFFKSFTYQISTFGFLFMLLSLFFFLIKQNASEPQTADMLLDLETGPDDEEALQEA